MIVVTGATGLVGSEVVSRLVSRGLPVRALTRNREKNRSRFPGLVEVVEADLDRPETLPAALHGATAAFLLTNSTERAASQQVGFLEAASRVGIQRLVNLSQHGADPNSSNRFQRYHAEVEAALQSSDLVWTILRPNLFMQGLLAVRESIRRRGNFALAAGEARISAVDIRDIAEVTVAVLTEPGHEHRIYDLTGPQALTHDEMAHELTRGLGRSVAYIDIPPEAMRSALLSFGFPEWQADGLVEEFEVYRRGEAAAVSDDVATITGHPPRSFAEFVKDYASAFR